MPERSPEPDHDTALEKLFYRTEPIRFVHWQELSGAKPTVVLLGVVTVVSFITGLSNLSEADIALAGPLADVLPGAAIFAQFGGVLFAFLLGGLTVGLQRRKRVAWYGTVVVLLATTALPLTTLQTTDVPLLLLVAIALPLVVWNRSRFDRQLGLSPLQIASLSSIVGVLAYGTIGSYGLRQEFEALETWSDAVYFVLVTIATVGYGDITPTTPEAKWFSLSVILFGTAAFTVAVGSLIGPVIESRMAAAVGQMSASDLSLLEDHVVVLGYGEMTEPILEEIRDETDVLVVTEDTAVVAELKDEGINVLTDDPTDADALEAAEIGTARGVVVATHDDAQDVLAVLGAKRANPDVRVVAAATSQTHVDKLEQVGADDVISPTTIGGRVLGRSVLEGTATRSLFESWANEDASEEE